MDHDAIAATAEDVRDLDGQVAELVRGGTVHGWLAVQANTFRNVFLARQAGCWVLVTWADGSLEIEEDYPPYALVPDLLAGHFADERRGEYQARWADADRQAELWARYGVIEEPGYYLARSASRSRPRS